MSSLLFSFIQITRIFCKGNDVAEIMANWSILHEKCEQFNKIDALPKKRKKNSLLGYSGIARQHKIIGFAHFLFI